ncbi:MAG TPA: S8 family serine peptidase [Thermodesulfovibrionales bacterium]|nr:S8 family serine peptidase [Thermodesulfovibrionales bacterium]
MRIKIIVAVVAAVLLISAPRGSFGQGQERFSKIARELTESVTLGPMRVIVILEVPNESGSLQTEHIRQATGTLASRAAGIARTVRTYDHFPLVAMEVTGKDNLSALGGMPEIRRVIPDRRRRLPEAGMTGSQTAAPLTYPQNIDRIGAKQAWNAGYSGTGWYVAVLDSGVLTTHELFKGKNIIEACFSSINDCPNGRAAMYGPGAARPFDPRYDGYEHGTHVAGIAVGNSGTIFGVAKDASLIAIQVFSRFFSAADCSPSPAPCVESYDSDEIAALDYVYSLRATYQIASVNMSLGGDVFSNQELCDTSADDPLYKTAIDILSGAGIAAVIASGNDGACGSLEAPGCISSAVSVGAVDDFDVEADFTDWHYSMLKFLAPGVNIYSAIPDTTSSYAYLTGTSMATPHVAGAWAILKQQNPQASVDEILSLLRDTGVAVLTSCPDIDDYKPRIQINASLNPSPIPSPSAPVNLAYPSTASPVLNFSQAMPVGVGPIAGLGDVLDLRVGFPPFAGPVNIYLAYVSSADPTIINNVRPDLSFQSFAFNDVAQSVSAGILPAGVIPWMQNTTGPVSESLFGMIPASQLPSGTYTVYALVTPPGSLMGYYLWTTSFVIP